MTTTTIVPIVLGLLYCFIANIVIMIPMTIIAVVAIVATTASLILIKFFTS